MESFMLIWIIFFLAFFIESIFWFGWLLLSFAMIWFVWINISMKELVYLGWYLAMIASIFVIITDYKSFSFEKLLKIFMYWIWWTILWTFLFDYLSSTFLLKFFAIFLFLISFKNIFLEKILNFWETINKVLLFIWGLIQWLFWTWAPFIVLAMKNSFTSKSELRSTMAVFFIVFNIIRWIQLYLQWNFNLEIIKSYYLLWLVVILAIISWYFLHLKFPDKYFKLWINILLLFASIVLFFK